MNTAQQIRKLRASAAADMKYSKLAKTDAIRLHLQQQVDACLAFFLPNARKKSVCIINGSSNIAYTDGDTIHINLTNSLVMKYRGDSQKYYAAMGILFHEVAHIVFNDFATAETATRLLGKGQMLYMNEFLSECAGEADLPEFVDAVKQGKYAGVFVRALHEMANCIADAHDEEKIIWARGGPEAFIGKCIAHSTESLWGSTATLEDMEKAVTGKGAAEELSLMFTLILQFARFGEINVRNEKTLKQSRFSQLLWECAPDLDQARQTDSSKVKYCCYNRVLLKMWPLLSDAINEAEQEQKQQSKNGQLTPEQQQAIADAISQALNQAANQAGTTQAPTQQRTSQQAQADNKAASNNQAANQAGAAQAGSNAATKDPSGNGAGKPASPPSSSASRQKTVKKAKGEENKALQSAVSAAAQEAAEKAVEKAIANNTLIEINAVDQNSTHKGVPVNVKRNLDISNGDAESAKRILDKVRPYSKRLQQKMLETLRDLQQGDVQKHRYFGSELNAEEAYRPDRKFWSNIKAPQDLPNMAVSVLVDQSGSMSGARIDAAREAAILLYDFCSGLNIPITVAGHCAGAGVEYSVFADYEKANGKDICRIAKMSPGGCNRDGLALTISGERLAKRPEEMKLLIIICDGQPNHREYGGDAAAKDLQSIVRKFKRMGIETIACAIGDDKDKIQKIYKDGFVDISDLSALPKKMTSIVKKRIVR